MKTIQTKNVSIEARTTDRRVRRTFAVTTAFASMLALASCATAPAPASNPGSATNSSHDPKNDADIPKDGSPQATESRTAQPRLAVTYDGGVLVLGATDGKVVSDFRIDGFNRVNPAGDGRHVLVSTTGGFQVLDTGSWSEVHGDHSHHFVSDPTLKDQKFPAQQPGHAVHHAGKTILFDDATGNVSTFESKTLSKETLPKTEDYKTLQAHHGVAVSLKNGQLLVTEGNSESRSGITLLDEAKTDGSRSTVATSTDCPGVHGEAMAQDEVVVVGCEDGLLVVKNGKITKVSSPDAYGRIGNQAGGENSSVVLGDYKKDRDAELERPTTFSLTDTATNKLQLVDTDFSYSFRSLGRSKSGDALVLGTDGKLHIYDSSTGKEKSAIKVVDEWEEPLDWQEPRPSLLAEGDTAFVTNPATKELHTVDLKKGEVTQSIVLPETPNELTGASNR
ncbi:zinc metallochaperone AztD [Paeniglutamicibacter sp. NPDC091659]|uniref:zinc metallochaperone AztD n=1 Tax=Paeniglutamicibacter sp. NPDC091659 TaxID=3364389 RepID=UPI0038160BA7